MNVHKIYGNLIKFYALFLPPCYLYLHRQGGYFCTLGADHLCTKTFMLSFVSTKILNVHLKLKILSFFNVCTEIEEDLREAAKNIPYATGRRGGLSSRH